jgi:hypothetical protein
MVKKADFEFAARLAVRNVTRHGDTDIFPFPFENHAFFDKVDSLVSLVIEYDEAFDEYLNRFPPQNVSSLTPVSYSGFRWATQIDPIWNVHHLACVLSLAKKIEAVRIEKEKNIVFSYRLAPNWESGDLFDRAYGWYQFMEASVAKANEHGFVVACDISEFYPRLGHHRLENALKQIAGDTVYPDRIMRFLGNFSNTRSFGLPIGGPAARVLSELTINQIDRLLFNRKIPFTRFADDYHIFCDNRQDAYKKLILLSEKLFDNQGLSLQKSKTRIMTSAEFRATNPLSMQKDDDLVEGKPAKDDSAPDGRLLRLSLRFDPYSATADKDYEALKTELRRFDVLGLLKSELAKSRIHTALARKIVAAIRYLDAKIKNEAILSILANSDVLYPIFSAALLTLDQVFDELDKQTQREVISHIRSLIAEDSHLMKVDVHLSYAIRVLAHQNSADNQALLQQIYEDRKSPIIRRDIILALARWGEWYWLSDLKNRFRELSGHERRAFVVASYTLKDEGKHWREHIEKELNPFEKFILSWSGEKAGRANWRLPL